MSTVNENIPDWYIKKLLSRQKFYRESGITKEDLTPKMIESYREVLIAKRYMRGARKKLGKNYVKSSLSKYH